MNFLKMFAGSDESEVLFSTSQSGQFATGLFQQFMLGSVYQPIVSLTHQRVVGYEALVRASKHHQPLSPNALFEFADSQGQSIELDRLCRAIHVLNFTGLENPAWLFLNISSSVVSGDCLSESLVQSALDHFKIRPESVVLEIVEDKIEDDKKLESFVKHYKSMGFRIAIDDFGRGESNFDRIWRIEPHIVKLDRSMLLHAERNEKARGVLKGLVHLLRQNGSLVVLEGIETEAQAEVALDSEADMFQGFYFGKPQSRPIATSEVKPRLSAIESRYRQLQYMRDEQSDLLLKSLRLEILNACDELARGADIHEACGSLLLIPAVKRCFILDHSGKQLTETVCSSLNVSLGDRMFNPLMDAEGACWRHREYFQRALSKPNQINISKPYIALPDAETTVTFSISTYTQQCHIVFCVDTSPEALKQDCQSLPMSLVGY